MHSVDTIVILCALGGFFGYFLIQLVVFRLIDHRGILQWLMNTFFMGGAINLSLSFFLLSPRTNWTAQAGTGGLIFGCAASFLIYGLMCFFYVLYIFGIYESSLRMRILREFYHRYPQGLTLEELLQSYNAEKILKTRLERFVGSGEVIVAQKTYRIGKQSTIFILLESVPVIIEKWIAGGDSNSKRVPF